MPGEPSDDTTSTEPSHRQTETGDQWLVPRLRSGDADAFTKVVDAWSPMMLRVAMSYVSTRASAEEIVQETWLAVVRGLDRFQGRSSLRTWVFRILTNMAKTRRVREARTFPWSSLGPEEQGGPTVDPHRFRGPEDEWPHHWTTAGEPRPWQPSPEDSVLSDEIRTLLAAVLEQLPERQRTVVTLRDVYGCSAEEVCRILNISAANQRVLLHRARVRLRDGIENYLRGAPATVMP